MHFPFISERWQVRLKLRAWIVESSGNRTFAQCQTSDLQFISMLSGLPEIVLHLLIHPAYRRRVKSNGEPDGHFRTNPRLAVEEACESVSADTECFGCFGNAQ